MAANVCVCEGGGELIFFSFLYIYHGIYKMFKWQVVYKTEQSSKLSWCVMMEMLYASENNATGEQTSAQNQTNETEKKQT